MLRVRCQPMAENLAPFASREIRRFSFQGQVDDRLDDPRAHEKESFHRCASGLGQSLPGRASSNSGHVRYAPKAEESSLPVICLCGLMATHMTSFPRSSLLKGGTVPRQEI